MSHAFIYVAISPNVFRTKNETNGGPVKIGVTRDTMYREWTLRHGHYEASSGKYTLPLCNRGDWRILCSRRITLPEGDDVFRGFDRGVRATCKGWLGGWSMAAYWQVAVQAAYEREFRITPERHSFNLNGLSEIFPVDMQMIERELGSAQRKQSVFADVVYRSGDLLMQLCDKMAVEGYPFDQGQGLFKDWRKVPWVIR